MDTVTVLLDITVPQGDNVSKIKRDHDNTRFHYCKKDLWELGLTQIVTPRGFSVNAYDPERCICDILREKKRMDIQVFQTALNTYFKDQNKDIHKLMKYASEFGIEKLMRQYTEVLL